MGVALRFMLIRADKADPHTFSCLAARTATLRQPTWLRNC